MQRLLLEQLLAWKDKPRRKPLLIDGARQTGKTYLLKNLLGREFPKVLHLDFLEDPGLAEAFAGRLSPRKVISAIELLTGQVFNPATDLLILDEIGECQRAVTSLKYFAEETPDWFVAASGSNIGLLDGFPVGKVEQHPLRPLTFQEFLRASGDQPMIKAFQVRDSSAAAHTRLFDQLTDYYFTGGMPEAVSNWFEDTERSVLQRTESVQRVHRDLVTGYQRDMGKYAGKTDTQLLQAVFDSIPSQLSAVIDESVKRFRFKGVHPRKSRYAQFQSAINWLHACRLVLKNHPLKGRLESPLAGRRKGSMVKLFMFDVGVLNHVLGSGYQELKQQGYSYKGYVAENFVQQELAAMGMEPGYSWTNTRTEIEFVISDAQGRVIPVEVKSGSRTRAKSLQAYEAKYQPHKTIKLTGTRGSDSRGDRHVVLPIYYARYLPEYLG